MRAISILRILAVLCVLAAPACGSSEHTAEEEGPPPNVEGTWTGSAEQTGSPNPTFTVKLNTKEGGELWGSITSMDGTFNEALISAGRIRGNRVTFSATANGSNFRRGHSFSFDATVEGDRMQGVWKDILDRNWGPFTLERVPSKAAGKAAAAQADVGKGAEPPE